MREKEKERGVVNEGEGSEERKIVRETFKETKREIGKENKLKVAGEARENRQKAFC